MSDSPAPLAPGKLWSVLLAITTVLAAATIGTIATMSNLTPWHAGLAKPAFTPPDWVFGPAWSLLYILMAAAFWRILHTPRHTPGKPLAVTLFLVQMALNALWSVAFFGLHSPLSGLIVIALLWLAILATLIAFARLDRPAAWLLAPYLAWVSFATLLDAAILRLNG